MRTKNVLLFAFFGTLALAALAVGSQSASKPAPVSKPPKVIQGSIQMIEGSILVVRWSAAEAPGSRQVDISTATFENAAGIVIPKPAFTIGDKVLVVADPNAPETSHPPYVPGRPHSMLIRLLPLKALVVERISGGGPNGPAKDVAGKG